jgi:hypothetical protein
VVGCCRPHNLKSDDNLCIIIGKEFGTSGHILEFTTCVKPQYLLSGRPALNWGQPKAKQKCDLINRNACFPCVKHGTNIPQRIRPSVGSELFVCLLAPIKGSDTLVWRIQGAVVRHATYTSSHRHRKENSCKNAKF